MALASFGPIQQLALSLLLTSERSWGRFQRLRPQETHSKEEGSRSPFYYLSRALTCFFEFRRSPSDSRLPVGTLTFATSATALALSLHGKMLHCHLSSVHCQPSAEWGPEAEMLVYLPRLQDRAWLSFFVSCADQAGLYLAHHAAVMTLNLWRSSLHRSTGMAYPHSSAQFMLCSQCTRACEVPCQLSYIPSHRAHPPNPVTATAQCLEGTLCRHAGSTWKLLLAE